jgi:hypothetical protein
MSRAHPFQIPRFQKRQFLRYARPFGAFKSSNVISTAKKIDLTRQDATPERADCPQPLERRVEGEHEQNVPEFPKIFSLPPPLIY